MRNPIILLPMLLRPALPGRALVGQAVVGPALFGRALPGRALPGRALPGRALPGRAPFGRALLGAALMLGGVGVASAQVTIDLHALDQLPMGSGVLPPQSPYLPGPRPAPRTPTRYQLPATPQASASDNQTGGAQAGGTHTGGSQTGGSQTGGSQTGGSQTGGTQTGGTQTARATPSARLPGVSTTTQPQPALPSDVPDTAALTPIAPPAASEQPAPPPPPPISPTAQTEAKESGGTMRVTFGGADQDLNPASVDQIKQFAVGTPAPDATFNVLAYAAGSATDPSAARRLSLSRALAVRSALMADGIASSRIFVRALGSQGGNGPADRVDISRLGANASANTGAAPAKPQ